MDASASTLSYVDKNNVYGFFLKIENTEFPTAVKQKSTVIKYTKLPDFDFEPKVSWPHQSMQTRLRRFITLGEPESTTTRSLKPDHISQSQEMATNLSKRKIVTISEDDEYDLHPRFSKDTKKVSSVKTSNRSIGTDFKEPKQSTQRTTSRLSSSSKYLKETKPSAKINVSEGKEPKPKSNYRSKQSNINHVPIDYTRSRNVKEKEPIRNSRSINSSKTSVSKNYVTPRESEKELTLIKSKLYDNLKSTTKKLEKSKVPPNKTPLPQTVNKVTYLKELHNKQKPVTVIHVPLEGRHRRSSTTTPGTDTSAYPSETELVKPTTTHVQLKDMDTSTDPLPQKVDSVTEMERFEPELIYKCVHSTDVQTEVINEIFDSLEIPNVTLTKDKNESNKESHSLHSKSLPNLQAPPCKVTANNEESSYHKSTSYIISRASVTYTTKQKINLHVVGSNDDAYSNQPPSPLSYPINVVSVFKKEMQNANANNIVINDKGKAKTSKEYKNRINDIKSLDCAYVANSDKLMKPSDIISTIRVNDDLFRSGYICEQFQRELNFIDSFFESLQYLENCSLSDKCYKDDKIDVLVKHPELLESEFDGKSLEYDSFFSKLENGPNIDDTETMASKNLFLLNILIRDEQRRAKNLLFVLKRREDALKDFTKSQILYLENKKKQDNTDISALKKKQRGALLKLQHECGEMQRMRRALLALSDRRKGSLMKTKKDLELKLKNNVDVDKIILSKKKPKRSASADRSSPLKCFELSSSGCEDSSTSRRNSAGATPERSPEHVCTKPTSAEKSIQTADTVTDTASVDRSTDTADEHFIIVDGGYLNILFQNLSLPQIFSGGKQYEVNEEALKNIVDSSNCQHRMNGADVQTLMDQIKNRDLDRSSSPSTARSLVEEFDQYYRGLNECDKSQGDETDYRSSSTICELSDAVVQVDPEAIENRLYNSASTMTIGSKETLVDTVKSDSEPCVCEVKVVNEDVPVVSPTGPLPVPVGAADVLDTPVTDASSWFPSKSSSSSTFSESSQSLCELVSSVTSFTPAQCEAEELRRQQLAIEREIKELEQQQCRLLVVREIPDKPPPPYTPPAESRVSKPRKFLTDDGTEERIRTYITEPDTEPSEPTDSFDVFVHDFCSETLERHTQDVGAKPWHACHLLPPKAAPEPAQLATAATLELGAVLAPAKPTLVSGVSSRRSDHIDDILFAEWRRVEPEWTALHTDEAVVKNQIFESIFQRILTDTVDEYKRTVLCDPVD